MTDEQTQAEIRGLLSECLAVGGEFDALIE